MTEREDNLAEVIQEEAAQLVGYMTGHRKRERGPRKETQTEPHPAGQHSRHWMITACVGQGHCLSP